MFSLLVSLLFLPSFCSGAVLNNSGRKTSLPVRVPKALVLPAAPMLRVSAIKWMTPALSRPVLTSIVPRKGGQFRVEAESAPDAPLQAGLRQIVAGINEESGKGGAEGVSDKLGELFGEKKRSSSAQPPAAYAQEWRRTAARVSEGLSAVANQARWQGEFQEVYGKKIAEMKSQNSGSRTFKSILGRYESLIKIVSAKEINYSRFLGAFREDLGRVEASVRKTRTLKQFLAQFDGVLRQRKNKKVKDEEIRNAALGIISYKSSTWSETEYNSQLYPMKDELEARGATKAQIAMFLKICADAPIKGGGFNNYSGD